MADKSIVDVTVKSNRKTYEQALDEVALRVLTMWGMEAESAAKQLAPVDTGLLRNSITWAIAGKGANQSQYKADRGDGSGSYSGQSPADKGEPRHVHIGSNVEYAMSQETGNFKDGPHAFLRPAIDNNRQHFQDILQGELEKALKNG